MTLYEYTGNLHIHTPYSDGTAYHEEIAEAAISAKLDFIVTTDHNIYVDGLEGYYGDDTKGYVLLLVGEEVHHRERLPQVNHCLIYNTHQEMTQFSPQPQKLIDEINQCKGLSFLAHPFDDRIPFMRPDSPGIPIPWADWDITGYTGLEIWNYMADWKQTVSSFRAIYTALFRPENAVTAPRPQTLAKWDELLAQGQHVVGIGSADAHAFRVNLGFFTHRVFPYDFLFSCVNTHILSPIAFVGDTELDSQVVYNALRQGCAFIGYDFIGHTRGFRFNAQGMDGAAEMGDYIRLHNGVTLQAKAPQLAHIKIIRHGEVVAENEKADTLTFTALEVGAYRVEVWLEFKGKMRCWILSNPIYVQL